MKIAIPLAATAATKTKAPTLKKMLKKPQLDFLLGWMSGGDIADEKSLAQFEMIRDAMKAAGEYKQGRAGELYRGVVMSGDDLVNLLGGGVYTTRGSVTSWSRLEKNAIKYAIAPIMPADKAGKPFGVLFKVPRKKAKIVADLDASGVALRAKTETRLNIVANTEVIGESIGLTLEDIAWICINPSKGDAPRVTAAKKKVDALKILDSKAVFSKGMFLKPTAKGKLTYASPPEGVKVKI